MNPNPDFNPEAGFCGALTGAGISHTQFAVQLVHNALARASRTAEFDPCESLLMQPVS